MFPSRWFGAGIGALVLLVLACTVLGALRLDDAGAGAAGRAAGRNLLIAAGLGAGVLGGIVGVLVARRRRPAAHATRTWEPLAPSRPRSGTLDNSAFQASIAALQAAADAARASTARRRPSAPEPAPSDGWTA